MLLLLRIFTITGSILSIGFGIWHFFVPKIWNWYSYIDQQATELVLAVRAINVFFSLSLVLFGLINLAFILFNTSNRFSLVVSLSASLILWVTRVIFQLIYPQGSMNPVIQYSMLAVFILVGVLYLLSLGFVISGNYLA